jgi:hypothetical protein
MNPPRVAAQLEGRLQDANRDIEPLAVAYGRR